MVAADRPDAGSRQTWDPARYARTARFVSDYGEALLELLAPEAHEHILDLGCGDGPLTQKIAGRAKRVVGLDASLPQVEAARARGLDAHHGDGHGLDFDEEFHAVFSNAALHWMLEPDQVIEGVWRALRPGGRFVAEMGGADNVEQILSALLVALERRGLDGRAAIPWYFPRPEAYRAKLEARGFAVVSMDHYERPTKLPGHLADWLETFAESFLSQVPEDQRHELRVEVSRSLEGALLDDQGVWWADYVRLRFHAVKPGR